MGIVSMTGFGRGEATHEDWRAVVELSAVNRRQFELRVNLPRPLAALEPRIQKRIGAALARGMVTANIGAQRRASSASLPVLDLDRAAALVASLRQAARHLKLDGEVTLDTLARMPELWKAEDPFDQTETAWHAIRPALEQALDAMLAMRRTEGNALAADLRKQLAALRRRLARVDALAPTVVRQYRRALLERIAAMQLAAGPGPEAIAREVALFADRSDIREERVRLASHLDQAEALLERRIPSGRELDFLCQEMLREINTIGAKANDARLTRHVIAMKSGLESVREQVQNIE
jgi:uncharacterized protein (TIGR00255 family)